MGGILNAIEISSQGLSVQRSKMNVVAENMANVETAETPEGGPYRRQRVLVSAGKEKVSFGSALKKADSNLVRTHAAHRAGSTGRPNRRAEQAIVKTEQITDSKSAFRLVHDPNHPKANEDGYVRMPDIDVIEEMVDLMAASRGYEANTVAISAAKKMANDALDI